MVPSLKNTALIFLELFSIECCAVLVSGTTDDVITYNINISKTKKDMPKKKAPFFFTLKSLSNKQQIYFTS